MKEDQDAPTRGRQRIQFWKLGLGLLLVFAEIKTLLTPDSEFPQALRYANITQQVSGYVVSGIIFVVGAFLIVSGVKSALPRQSNREESEP
jgi:hypothetical protein